LRDASAATGLLLGAVLAPRPLARAGGVGRGRPGSPVGRGANALSPGS